MPDTDVTFKFFPQLNKEETASWASSRTTLTSSFAERFFSTDSLQDKLVRSIAARRVIPIKEVLECFEFVARVRKTMRAPTIADLCCGHGLVGLLFGVFERQVEQVLLIDKIQPASYAVLSEAMIEVAPWLAEKATFETRKLDSLTIPNETSVVSAHACGKLTDDCISLATNAKANVAVMPCCYPRRICPAPKSILAQFGEADAFDIDRTYRLEQAGYCVKWTYIPKSITPMNRILIGRR